MPGAAPETVAAPPRRTPPWAEVYAALDLGTNNCRLLVARGAGGGFRVIDAFSRIVRLGEGLSASGVLSEAAMQRTLEALKVCAAKIAHRGVTRARYVATAACRRAANCGTFLERVRETTGIAIETITTEEEARLAVAGCAPLLDRRQPYAIVFDIGGGSTELVWLRLPAQSGRHAEILGSISLPFGVVTLTERYGGDVIAPDRYAAMVREAAASMADFAIRHEIARQLAAGTVQMLGSSGTVTTLAGIQLDLPRYIRNVVDGSMLGFAAIAAISARLAAMSCAERAAHPCIGSERADLVVAGCAILAAICALWPVGRLRVADRGVREGILLNLVTAGD
ncbi:MAG: Ppx/GppA family phosphatase [Alphaproteobacteria bacterium]|nr:Ppx/GppA family phosphatase [Alphaproteobacteria bacterium]